MTTRELLRDMAALCDGLAAQHRKKGLLVSAVECDLHAAALRAFLARWDEEEARALAPRDSNDPRWRQNAWDAVCEVLDRLAAPASPPETTQSPPDSRPICPHDGTRMNLFTHYRDGGDTWNCPKCYGYLDTPAHPPEVVA